MSLWSEEGPGYAGATRGPREQHQALTERRGKEESNQMGKRQSVPRGAGEGLNSPGF